jgi:hypothetical protein
VISEIAKAAYSTAEFDEMGVFRWRNHTRFLNPPTAAQRTITTVGDIASITVSEEIDACRNYCVVPYQDWTGITAVANPNAFVDSQVRTIPPGGTITVTYTMDEQEFDVGPPLVDDDQFQNGGSALRFSDSLAGTGAVKGRVETQISRSDGTMTLTLRSWSPNPVFTANKSGQPSIHITTEKPSADPVLRVAVAQDQTSQQKYGLQQYTADASDWVQDQATAASLAAMLNTAGKYPVPLFSNVQVLYDPRLQLGDVVELVDYSGAYLDTLAWVVGITVEAANDGTVTQTLTLRGTSYNADPVTPVTLHPDPAVDPLATTTHPKYSDVKSGYPTYGDITAKGLNYRNFDWTR